MALWMMIKPHVNFWVSGISIVTVLVLAVAGSFRLGDAHKILKWISVAIFCAMAPIALFHYAYGHGTQVYKTCPWFFNPYEFYHYYIGAKYNHELGYENMYKATVLADYERTGQFVTDRVRSLETHKLMYTKTIPNEAEALKSKFTVARWNEFTDDTLYLKSKMPIARWKSMLTDKGYNPSPVWTLVGGFIANSVPTSNLFGLQCLAAIDLVLILMMFGAIWWAFDLRTAAIWAAFFGTLFSANASPTLRASFMRLDWMACLVIGTCMIRKKQMGIAGVLVAYAATTRLFPAVYFAGMGIYTLRVLAIGLEGCDPIWRGRKPSQMLGILIDRLRQWEVTGFWVCATLAVVVLVAGSFMWAGGVEQGTANWKDFSGKILQHDKDISSWRVGFKYVVLAMYDNKCHWGGDTLGDALKSIPAAVKEAKVALTSPAGKAAAETKTFDAQQTFNLIKPLWMLMIVVVLAVYSIRAWTFSPDKATAACYILMFFLSASTYYYHVILSLPLLYFAYNAERKTHALGVILIFAFSLAGHIGLRMHTVHYATHFYASCVVMVFCIYMLFLPWREQWAGLRSVAVPEPLVVPDELIEQEPQEEPEKQEA